MQNKTLNLSRRELIKNFGLGAVALSGLFGASHKAFAKNAQHIVMVGGGIGGRPLLNIYALPMQMSKLPSSNLIKNTSLAYAPTS